MNCGIPCCFLQSRAALLCNHSNVQLMHFFHYNKHNKLSNFGPTPNNSSNLFSQLLLLATHVYLNLLYQITPLSELVLKLPKKTSKISFQCWYTVPT